MKGFYQNLTSYFKFAGHFGQGWKRTNSIGQGCALSMCWANLFGALWCRVIELDTPRVSFGVFVDDKTVRARSKLEWIRAIRVSLNFDKVTGCETNVKKTLTFANTEVGRKLLQKLSADGVNFPNRP